MNEWNYLWYKIVLHVWNIVQQLHHIAHQLPSSKHTIHSLFKTKQTYSAILIPYISCVLMLSQKAEERDTFAVQSHFISIVYFTFGLSAIFIAIVIAIILQCAVWRCYLLVHTITHTHTHISGIFPNDRMSFFLHGWAQTDRQTDTVILADLQLHFFTIHVIVDRKFVQGLQEEITPNHMHVFCATHFFRLVLFIERPRHRYR